jgi:hypothetical protein
VAVRYACSRYSTTGVSALEFSERVFRDLGRAYE